MNAKKSMTLLVALAAAGASAAANADATVRFHPQKEVWTHELEAARGLGSVVVPNTAIVNADGDAVTVERVRFELVAGGEVVATQFVRTAELDAIAKRGGALAASGMIEALAFQFAPKTLFGEGVAVSDARTLEKGEALYVPTRTFAFNGKPDTVRVVAELADGAPDAVGTLAIRQGTAPGTYRFPMDGRWLVAAGATLHSHHRWVVPEEFALDIVKVGDGGLTHRGDGTRMKDYYGYGASVRAVAAGKVVAVRKDAPDNVAMLRKPGEALADYQKRVVAMQGETLAQGADALAGNHVVVAHEGGVYSVYAHLAPASVKVEVGATVAAGQAIGALGGSGNSTEPHLHFHLCDSPSPLMCAGMPVKFDGIELPYSDYPRQVQTGDIVETR